MLFNFIKLPFLISEKLFEGKTFSNKKTKFKTLPDKWQIVIANNGESIIE